MTMDQDPLAPLIARARQGDGRAFDDLVMACQPALRLHLSWRCPSIDVVEEVLQATFITAFERLDTYRGEAPFPAWLKGIARHLLAQEHEVRRRQARLHGGVLDEALLAACAPAEDDGDDGREAAALQDCLGRLAPRARDLVARRYAADEAVEDIAATLRQKPNTVAVTLMRIRAELRDCLVAKGVAR